MFHLHQCLTPKAVRADLPVSNKKALFQQLALIAAQAHHVDSHVVLDRLTERERLGSTGFGGGIAIPHGKIEGLESVIGVLVRLTTPIDFEAIDDLPVDLVFMLLSPVDGGPDHLKALATVSRMMRDQDFVAKLHGAANDDALLALLTSYVQPATA
jgi:PTS system nitrogen regulatory IIA component